VNIGQLVQAVSCTQEAQKHMTLTFNLWPWYSTGF